MFGVIQYSESNWRMPHFLCEKYGCVLKCRYPQIIHFNRVFHDKPSILGVPLFLDFHPNTVSLEFETWRCWTIYGCRYVSPSGRSVLNYRWWFSIIVNLHPDPWGIWPNLMHIFQNFLVQPPTVVKFHFFYSCCENGKGSELQKWFGVCMERFHQIFRSPISSNEKRVPCCVGYFGGWNATQICGDYNKL